MEKGVACSAGLSCLLVIPGHSCCPPPPPPPPSPPPPALLLLLLLLLLLVLALLLPSSSSLVCFLSCSGYHFCSVCLFTCIHLYRYIHINTCVYMYIHTYTYTYTYTYIYVFFAVGSISGPHFTLCWVNKWSTFSFFVFLLSARRMRFKKTRNWKQKSRVNKWSTSASKNSRKICGPLIDLIVNHLLTLLLLTPKLKKTMPRIGWKPISQCFQRNTATNTKNKKQKHDNFNNCKHNCPLWFWPEVVPLFVPPFFSVFPLPVAHLTTKQHKKQRTKNNKTTTKQQL